MSRQLRLVLTGVVAFALLGCDDDEPEPTCDDVEHPCEAEGTRQCADDGSEAIWECRARGDSCLAWSEVEACGAYQECNTAGGDPACACDNECDAEGATYCVDDVIVECISAGTCLIEEDGPDCAADGQTCEDSADGAQCTGCEHQCDSGAEQCFRDVIQSCEIVDTGCRDWVDTEDCGDSGMDCVEDGDNAECQPTCEDECDAEDDTRCQDDDVETCTLMRNGCLEWAVSDTCNPEEGEACEVIDGDAECVGCIDDCDEGTFRCVDEVLEACLRPADGCSAWEEDTICTDVGLDGHCVETGEGEASCVALEGGDSCAEPLVVDSFPFELSGDDFTAIFTNTLSLSGDGCEERTGTAEAVFAVDMTIGQVLRIQEVDEIDVVISVMTTCEEGAACALSEDLSELDGHLYTADADGRVYVIVEVYSDTTTFLAFDIRMDLGEREVCDDLFDNDLDELADCDDADCFGVAPCDAAELNCRDGADNDDDDATDCDDSDCVGTYACIPEHGIYERFEVGEVIDLVGRSLAFTPDAEAEFDYSFTAEETDAFSYEVGTGTASRVYDMRDDGYIEYRFVNLPSFEFYGTTYRTMFLSSNGYITFGRGTDSYTTSVEAFFGLPIIAALRSDLSPDDPSSAGEPEVTVDDSAERVVVTFLNVPRFYVGEPSGPNDFQMVLNADGSIEITYLNINQGAAIVGIGAGSGTGEYPAETNFVELPPEDCSDDRDNDLDDLTDCDDPDCFGVSPCDEAELNCSDGEDNDGDDEVDCDDSDCDDDPACLPESECGDDADNDLDGLTDCDDSDCFGVAPCDEAELNCADGEDNDGDDDVDCDDSDCAEAPVCLPRPGIYQHFEDEPIDLAGHSITFTPSADEYHGFTWEAAAGLEVFPYEVGMGTATDTFDFGDDDYEEYAFVNLPEFEFYGETYSSVFVGSNGYLTFGDGSTSMSIDVSAFYSLPIVAGLRRDLDPGDPSTAGDPRITVDDSVERVVVTFENVPRWYAVDPAGPNDFQMVLNADGSVELHYLHINVPSAIVGVGSGADDGDYPAESDFVVPPPEDCSDDADNDLDGLTDCDDPDCFGVAPCDEAELNCSDGEDNDGDDDTDCDDSDCVGDPDCGVLTINELFYDHGGAPDIDEFVELYFSVGAMDLTGYTLVHYDGETGAVLWAADLTDLETDADGFFVLGSSRVAAADAHWADVGVADTNALQNGPGEALVLYSGWDGDDGVMVDAVCWAGAGIAPCEGSPAPGLAMPNWETSLGRYPDGADADENSTDFVAAWWVTPGEANTPAQPAGFVRSSILAQVPRGTTWAIPDDDETGVTTIIDTRWGANPETITNVHVGVRVRHTYIGDLTITLTSPAGTAVVLHDGTGADTEDIATVYDFVTEPDEGDGAMDAFNGEAGRGRWRLNVNDTSADDVGDLIEWVIWLN